MFKQYYLFNKAYNMYENENDSPWMSPHTVAGRLAYNPESIYDFEIHEISFGPTPSVKVISVNDFFFQTLFNTASFNKGKYEREYKARIEMYKDEAFRLAKSLTGKRPFNIESILSITQSDIKNDVRSSEINRMKSLASKAKTQSFNAYIIENMSIENAHRVMSLAQHIKL